MQTFKVAMGRVLNAIFNFFADADPLPAAIR